MKKAKFLNLANNDLKAFPQTLKGTNISEVYLAGNPIYCCGFLIGSIQQVKDHRIEKCKIITKYVVLVENGMELKFTN